MKAGQVARNNIAHARDASVTKRLGPRGGLRRILGIEMSKTLIIFMRYFLNRKKHIYANGEKSNMLF